MRRGRRTAVRAHYDFRDGWSVAAPPDAVRDLVVDLERYPDWWPQVLAVAWLDRDHARVLCRSTLPYTLDLVLRAASRDLPVLEVEVGGDLVGTVRFVLSAEGAGTRLELEQHVAVSGLLALATFPARRLLEWNHDRMMRGCRAGMRAALEAGPAQTSTDDMSA